MTPGFILSTLKCNNMIPQALKLHLQSIKLQRSFYSLNFCYFTYAMMSRFAKFQGFFRRPFSSMHIGGATYKFSTCKLVLAWSKEITLNKARCDSTSCSKATFMLTTPRTLPTRGANVGTVPGQQHTCYFNVRPLLKAERRDVLNEIDSIPNLDLRYSWSKNVTVCEG
jgi:hypothetical protein